MHHLNRSRCLHLNEKLANKTVSEKCTAIKDLEQEMSNKDVADKYGVPRNTVSTWFKYKEKLLSSLEKAGSNSKRKKLRDGELENVDKAVYSWFVSTSTHRWAFAERKGSGVRS